MGKLVSKETVLGDLFVILVQIMFSPTVYMIVFVTYPCCSTFSISLVQLLALFARNACIKIPPNNLISKSGHNLGIIYGDVVLKKKNHFLGLMFADIQFSHVVNPFL